MPIEVGNIGKGASPVASYRAFNVEKSFKCFAPKKMKISVKNIVAPPKNVVRSMQKCYRWIEIAGRAPEAILKNRRENRKNRNRKIALLGRKNAIFNKSQNPNQMEFRHAVCSILFF